MQRRRRPLAVRFWEKVERRGPDECWPWTGSTFAARGGYGKLSDRRSVLYAHRVSYELAHGDPGAMCVLHRCDNPQCVNPAHLFLGTRTDNSADKVAKGRQRSGSLRGAANPMARLDESEVASIRALAGTMSANAIGRRFGVSGTHVRRIQRGEVRRGDARA